MAALRQVTTSEEPNDAGRRAPAVFDADRMRRAFEKASRPPVEPPSSARGKFDIAYDRLDKAATAFDLLLGRCQQLEAQLKTVSERAKAEVADRERMIIALRDHALGLQSRLDQADERMASMAAQSAAAEDRAGAVKAAAEAAAAEAKALSMELHDRVFAALGLCSRVHGALEAVAAQAASAPVAPTQAVD